MCRRRLARPTGGIASCAEGEADHRAGPPEGRGARGSHASSQPGNETVLMP